MIAVPNRVAWSVTADYPDRTKAMDITHRCPVCRESYYPRHSQRLDDQSGEMLTRVTDRVCVKGSDDWVMVYWHHPDAEYGVPATELEAPE